MAIFSASAVLALFPHQTIHQTHTPGEDPNFATLEASFTQLRENATCVPCTDADIRLGYLVLALGSQRYMAISENQIDHARPDAPPLALVIPPGTTAALISEMRTAYEEQKSRHQLWTTVDTCLKQLLIAATDDRFLAGMKHATYGYALCSCFQLMEHLVNNHGRITPEMLATNETTMRQPWAPSAPIEHLFTQLDDGQAFATSGAAPYTDAQLVNYGYAIISATGLMELACRDWRAKPIIDKTWSNFKIDFKIAHLDLRLAPTTGNAGFRANNINGNEPPADAAALAETEALIATLADAAIVNNAQMADMTASIATLQSQLRATNTALSTFQRDANQQDRRGNNPDRRRPPPARAPANAPPANNDNRYCWTHGGRCHPGTECRNPAEGHIAGATLNNRQGGNTRFTNNARG